MLSQTVEYALRAMLQIARDPAHSARVVEIADAIDAPRNYLAKILGQLARAGLLESARGPAGGFRLDRPVDDIRLSDIVSVFELDEQRRCLIGPEPCGTRPDCTVHAHWAPIAKRMDEFFSNTTLADLLLNSSLK